VQVASLRLAPHQQVTIAAMRRVMMHNLGLLLRRRQELVSSLTVRTATTLSQAHSQILRTTRASNPPLLQHLSQHLR
jgi:hypothetical protein